MEAAGRRDNVDFTKTISCWNVKILISASLYSPTCPHYKTPFSGDVVGTHW
jgi:hypothetical protein